jgi:hypothetical protein
MSNELEMIVKKDYTFDYGREVLEKAVGNMIDSGIMM